MEEEEEGGGGRWYVDSCLRGPHSRHDLRDPLAAKGEPALLHEVRSVQQQQQQQAAAAAAAAAAARQAPSCNYVLQTRDPKCGVTQVLRAYVATTTAAVAPSQLRTSSYVPAVVRTRAAAHVAHAAERRWLAFVVETTHVHVHVHTCRLQRKTMSRRHRLTRRHRSLLQSGVSMILAAEAISLHTSLSRTMQRTIAPSSMLV